jgi:hypothetical protein
MLDVVPKPDGATDPPIGNRRRRHQYSGGGLDASQRLQEFYFPTSPVNG